MFIVYSIKTYQYFYDKDKDEISDAKSPEDNRFIKIDPEEEANEENMQTPSFPN